MVDGATSNDASPDGGPANEGPGDAGGDAGSPDSSQPDAGDGEGPCDAADPLDGNPCNTKDDAAICHERTGSTAFTCSCGTFYQGELCAERKSAGSRKDGDVILDGDANLAVDNTGSRSCADGGDMVFYTVTSVVEEAAAVLGRAPAPGCLDKGDEVLILKLLGGGSLGSDVGAYEVRRVTGIVDNRVSLDQALQRDYGTLSASAPNDWVVMQRVPNYRSFVVQAEATVTVTPVDIQTRTATGVFVLRGGASLILEGTIDASGAGLPGGAQTLTAATNGQDGTSPAGASSNGGAGGTGDNGSCAEQGSGGGGGGHARRGEDASADCGGSGGPPHGDAWFERLFLGSGGGSGGTDDNSSNDPPGGAGGAGGGVVVLSAETLTVSGAIDASGADGEGDLVAPTGSCETTDACWDYAGPGGGGAGGSIWLSASVLEVGTQRVVARGGRGGLGRADKAGHGGDGSVGRIVLQHGGSFVGRASPVAELSAFDCASVAAAGFLTDEGDLHVLDPDGFGGVAAGAAPCGL